MASTISRIGQHRRRPRWLAPGLDDLLARRPGQAATWLSWLRNAPQPPAARNILRLIERLTPIRALDLDRARADMIPAWTFDRLADEGSRITRQNLGETNARRRHAPPAAHDIRLEERLTAVHPTPVNSC